MHHMGPAGRRRPVGAAARAFLPPEIFEIADTTPYAGVAESWSEWLQTHRVELNAMSTPQFIQWLDTKLIHYDKLIPPGDVIEAQLDGAIETKIRAAVTARILSEAGFEAQVATAIASIRKPEQIVLKIGIHDLFRREPDREWRDTIEAVAAALTGETA